jgi:lycopene cyclase domain-containing protein
VFSYFALNHLIENDFLFPHQDLISSVLSIALLVAGLYYIEHLYTGLTFILLGLLLAYQILKLRPRYMGRFYVAFAFTLIPFLLINGLLTGSFIDEPVVWYDDNETLGIRLGTIPFEDIFYGMLLILTNIIVLEWLEERERFRAWTKA